MTRKTTGRFLATFIFVAATFFSALPGELAGLNGSQVFAIDINVNFDSGASDANYDFGGVNIIPIMQDAAAYWEDIIEDPWTVNIDFYWDSTISGDAAIARVDSISTETNAVIRFKTNFSSETAIPWWFDPTPNGNTEFNMAQELVEDLSSSEIASYYTGTIPHPLEAKYRGEGLDGIVNGLAVDAFTIALHEIGHALGFNPLNALGEVNDDDDFDLAPENVWGFNVAVWQNPDGSFHHRIPDALMNKTAISTWERVLPSATDVFAIASAGEWTQIDLPRKDFAAEYGSSWHTAANWAGNRVPDSDDDVFVRLGGSATVNSSAYAKNVTVNSQGLTINDALNVGAILSIEGNADVQVNSGGSVDAGTYSIKDTAQFSAGSLFYLAKNSTDIQFATLANSAQMSAQIEYVGYLGGAIFDQTGGTNTVGNQLTLAWDVSSAGEYNLTSGQLTAPTEFVGYQGTGTFTQTGGTHQTDD